MPVNRLFLKADTVGSIENYYITGLLEIKTQRILANHLLDLYITNLNNLINKTIYSYLYLNIITSNIIIRTKLDNINSIQ